MAVLEEDPIKNERARVVTRFSPTLRELSVAKETRVLIQSGLKPNTNFPKPQCMMLQIKFDFDRPAGLGDIHV